MKITSTPGRISIIMLTYNSVAYIKQAIVSVEQQLYTEWELILQDDVSEDGTWELVQVLAQQNPRIRLERNVQRLGIVKNRARAAQRCTGEFICHVDGDDYLEPWSLSEMVLAFRRNPDTALFYSDLVQVDRFGRVEHYSAAKNFDPKTLHQHGWRHFGMYRSSVLEEIEGYNTRITPACEDGDLFMQIAELHPIRRLPRILYNYRNHGGNDTLSNKVKCKDCTDRPVCNFMRVWARSAGYDPITFTPLEPVTATDK